MEAIARSPKKEPEKSFFVSVVVSLYPKEIAKVIGRRFLPTPADRSRFVRDGELGAPITFKILMDRASGQMLVFPPGGAQPSPTLSFVKEISRAKRRVSTIEIGLGHSAICCSLVRTETIGVQKKVHQESVFDFPFQAVDYFLTKVATEDRLMALVVPPVTINTILSEHEFDYLQLKAGADHVDAFGARWVPVDESLPQQDLWFGFGSRFARIALNYVVFSPGLVAPLVADMTSIHRADAFDSEGFKQDVESRVAFTVLAKKIDMLRVDTPYSAPPA